jgi:hypothetical protein
MSTETVAWIYPSLGGHHVTFYNNPEDPDCMNGQALVLRSAYESLEAELSAAKADANRYRWLRQQKENLMYCFTDPGDFGIADVACGLFADELDRAIDAGMAEHEYAPPGLPPAQ